MEESVNTYTYHLASHATVRCAAAPTGSTAASAARAASSAATGTATIETLAQPANVLELADEIDQRTIGLGQGALRAAAHGRVERIEPDQSFRRVAGTQYARVHSIRGVQLQAAILCNNASVCAQLRKRTM